MKVYAYLRASTKDQDAQRAKSELFDFAREKGLIMCISVITKGNCRTNYRVTNILHDSEVSRSSKGLALGMFYIKQTNKLAYSLNYVFSITGIRGLKLFCHSIWKQMEFSLL